MLCVFVSLFCAASLFILKAEEDEEGMNDAEEDDFKTDDDDDDDVTEMEVENRMQKRRKVIFCSVIVRCFHPLSPDVFSI